MVSINSCCIHLAMNSSHSIFFLIVVGSAIPTLVLNRLTESGRGVRLPTNVHNYGSTVKYLSCGDAEKTLTWLGLLQKSHYHLLYVYRVSYWLSHICTYVRFIFAELNIGSFIYLQFGLTELSSAVIIVLVLWFISLVCFIGCFNIYFTVQFQSLNTFTNQIFIALSKSVLVLLRLLYTLPYRWHKMVSNWQ